MMTKHNKPVLALASLLVLLFMTACSGGGPEFSGPGGDGPSMPDQMPAGPSEAFGAAGDNAGTDRPRPGGGIDTERDLPGDGQLLEEGLSEEMAEQIIGQIDSNLDYEYDADAQTLTVTTGLDEARLNEAINSTFEQAGYGPASVDFVSGGLTVVVEDLTYEGEDYGTVTLSVSVVASDCRAVATVTEASANGRSLPQPVIDQLNNTITDALDTSIDTLLSNGDLPGYLDWCVTNITVTDTSANVTVVFSW